MQLDDIIFTEYTTEMLSRQKDYELNDIKNNIKNNYGYVYIICCEDDIIKIGRSYKPNSRILGQISIKDNIFKLTNSKVSKIYISSKLTNTAYVECYLLCKLNDYLCCPYHKEVFKIDIHTFQKLCKIRVNTKNIEIRPLQQKLIENINDFFKDKMIKKSELSGIYIDLSDNNVNIKWKYN